jgi:hypothetical protein
MVEEVELIAAEVLGEDEEGRLAVVEIAGGRGDLGAADGDRSAAEFGSGRGPDKEGS